MWRWAVMLAFVMFLPSAWAGKLVGEEAGYIREQGVEQRFFYVAAGNGAGQIEYICRAFPGTTGSKDTSSSVWQVQRFTYDSSNRISTIAFAGSDDRYDQICDNRTSLSY